MLFPAPFCRCRYVAPCSVYVCVRVSTVLLVLLTLTDWVSTLCIVIANSKSKDQPGKVAIPARGQLNKENEYFPVPARA